MTSYQLEPLRKALLLPRVNLFIADNARAPRSFLRPRSFQIPRRRTIAEPRLPLVSDGTIFRVLHKLFILDGERFSYRTLDVQEIGSAYQTIMGFAIEVATGQRIALKGKRKNGSVPASPVLNLQTLLAVKSSERAKWLKENADTELKGDADKKLKAAASVDDLLAALEKRIDRGVRPGGTRPKWAHLWAFWPSFHILNHRKPPFWRRSPWVDLRRSRSTTPLLLVLGHARV